MSSPLHGCAIMGRSHRFPPYPRVVPDDGHAPHRDTDNGAPVLPPARAHGQHHCVATNGNAVMLEIVLLSTPVKWFLLCTPMQAGACPVGGRNGRPVDELHQHSAKEVPHSQWPSSDLVSGTDESSCYWRVLGNRLCSIFREFSAAHDCRFATTMVRATSP